jgi:hypothetical protein
MSKIEQAEIFQQIKKVGLTPYWYAGSNPETGASGYLAGIKQTGKPDRFVDVLSYGKTLEEALKAAFLRQFDWYRSTIEVNTMFKFNIGQTVFFLKNDKLFQAKIRVRQITESDSPLRDETKSFSRTTADRVVIVYGVKGHDVDVNWQFKESQLFASKQELVDSL